MRCLLSILIVLFSAATAGAQGWISFLDSPGADGPQTMTFNAVAGLEGRTVAAGWSGDRSLVCAFDAQGEILWARRGPAGSEFLTLALDAEGVYAAGALGDDLLVAAFNLKGEPLWLNVYDAGMHETPQGITLAADSVTVVGDAQGRLPSDSSATIPFSLTISRQGAALSQLSFPGFDTADEAFIAEAGGRYLLLTPYFDLNSGAYLSRFSRFDANGQLLGASVYNGDPDKVRLGLSTVRPLGEGFLFTGETLAHADPVTGENKVYGHVMLTDANGDVLWAANPDLSQGIGPTTAAGGRVLAYAVRDGSGVLTAFKQAGGDVDFSLALASLAPETRLLAAAAAEDSVLLSGLAGSPFLARIPVGALQDQECQALRFEPDAFQPVDLGAEYASFAPEAEPVFPPVLEQLPAFTSRSLDAAQAESAALRIRQRCGAGEEGPRIVTVSGRVLLDGEPVCGMVYSQGVLTDSCNEQGSFMLKDLKPDDGALTVRCLTARLEVFERTLTADTHSMDLAISMQKETPDRALSVAAELRPGQNGGYELTGTVSYYGEPVCATLLASGAIASSCNEAGEFHLTAPLNPNGDIELLAFAPGYTSVKAVLRP